MENSFENICMTKISLFYFMIIICLKIINIVYNHLLGSVTHCLQWKFLSRNFQSTKFQNLQPTMLYWCFHANLFLFLPMYLYRPNVNEFSAYSPLPPPNPPQNSASCQCFWLRPLRRLRSPSHTVPISFALSVSCENRPQQPGKICAAAAGWLAVVSRPQ